MQFDILDDTMAFESYRLIIVPEDIVASVAVQKRMDAYVQMGGRILACGKGGILSAVAPYFKREGDRFCSHS